MFKAVLVILLLAMVVSLFTSLNFLFRDVDQEGSRRLWYALGVRVSLAISVVALIAFGLATGRLNLDAPWHHLGSPEQQAAP